VKPVSKELQALDGLKDSGSLRTRPAKRHYGVPLLKFNSVNRGFSEQVR